MKNKSLVGEYEDTHACHLCRIVTYTALAIATVIVITVAIASRVGT